MDDFLNVSGLHSRERTLMLDISQIPKMEYEEDIMESLAMLKSIPDGVQEKQYKIKARELKKRVITVLETYQMMIANNDQMAKQLIPRDLQEISDIYDELLQYQSQTDEEVKNILSLVREFLNKMTVRSNQKTKSQPPVQQSFQSDESTSLNCRLQLISTKITSLIGQIDNYPQIQILANQVLITDSIDSFRELRQSSKSINDSQVQKLVKACFLKMKLTENNVTKREFYDTVIKLRSSAPSDHQAHQVMIGQLYEEALQQGLLINDWELFLKQKLNLLQ